MATGKLSEQNLLESLKHQPEAPRTVKILSQAGKCATHAAHRRESAESWCTTFGLPWRRSGKGMCRSETERIKVPEGMEGEEETV